MNLQDYLWVSDEVKEAVEHNKPVVALESTIISHGMPYPQNVETALAVETVIREMARFPPPSPFWAARCALAFPRNRSNILAKRA